jgi:hypothetical protein
MRHNFPKGIKLRGCFPLKVSYRDIPPAKKNDLKITRDEMARINIG